jgi:hypothetical protein
MDTKKDSLLLCYKYVFKLVPKETVSEQIIVEIDDH